MLSFEIKIRWTSTKKGKEKYLLFLSEKLAASRSQLPSVLLISEVGYSVVITGNFVKLSFKENLTFPELFWALMADLSRLAILINLTQYTFSRVSDVIRMFKQKEEQNNEDEDEDEEDEYSAVNTWGWWSGSI